MWFLRGEEGDISLTFFCFGGININFIMSSEYNSPGKSSRLNP